MIDKLNELVIKPDSIDKGYELRLHGDTVPIDSLEKTFIEDEVNVN